MAEEQGKSTAALVQKILDRQRDIEMAVDVIRDDLDEIQRRLDLNRLDLKTVLHNDETLRNRPWERAAE